MKKFYLIFAFFVTLKALAQPVQTGTPSIKYVDFTDVTKLGDKNSYTLQIEGVSAISFTNNLYMTPDQIDVKCYNGFEISGNVNYGRNYRLNQVINSAHTFVTSSSVLPGVSGKSELYIGFRYLKNSQYQYGWIRIEVANIDNSPSFGFTLKDLAYQTQQGTLIAAGEKTYYTVANPSMQGHYPFDGNANDVSGNGYNGAIVGTTIAAPDFTGATGKALELDGSSYVDLTNPAYFNNPNYTYSIRFKNPNFCFTSYLISMGDGYASQPTEQTLQLSSSASYAMTSLEFNRNFLSKPFSEFGTWHQIVMVRSNYEMKLFLDGVLMGSTVTTYIGSMMGYSTFYIPKGFIGSNPTNTNAKFKGVVDDLKIYNYALTDDAALKLSAEAASPQINTKFTAYFPMKESVIDEGPTGVKLRRGALQTAEPAVAANACNISNEAVEFTATGSSNPLYANSCLFSTKEFTYATWYKIKTNPQPAAIGTLIHAGGSPQDHALYIYNVGGKVSLTAHTYYKDQSNFITSKSITYPLTSVTSVGWHHAAFVRKSDSLLLYFDGSLVSTVALPVNTIGYGTNTLCLGSRMTNANSSFQGFMDETKIYATPLSRTEVKELYDLGLNCVITSQNPEEEEEGDKILFYPNPVGNELFILNEMGVESIVIFDITGQKVLSDEAKGSSINVSALRPGVYFVEINKASGKLFKKIIKQ